MLHGGDSLGSEEGPAYLQVSTTEHLVVELKMLIICHLLKGERFYFKMDFKRC